VWIFSSPSTNKITLGCFGLACRYRGPQLAVWGSDYAFTDASSMYSNMDKIIFHVNADPAKYGIRLQYTTLAQYADHVRALDLTFPVKSYPLDFEKGWPHQWNLSLANNFTTQYQTGAATSRAELKQTTRAVSGKHRAAEAAVVLATLDGRLPLATAAHAAAQLFPAWDTLGIMQHHDALTGTMSTEGSFPWGPTVDAACVAGDTTLCPPCSDKTCRVLEDYMERLGQADVASTEVHLIAVAALANASVASLRATQDGTALTVVVVNPYSARRRSLVSAELPSALVPTSHEGHLPQVLDTDGVAVAAQLSTDGHRIHWVAELGPLGWSEFHFAYPAGGGIPATTAWPRPRVPSVAGNFSNGVVTLEYDVRGRIAATINGAVRTKMAQDYMVYVAPSHPSNSQWRGESCCVLSWRVFLAHRQRGQQVQD
jgi:hypothetical protein